jgi:transposase
MPAKKYRVKLTKPERDELLVLVNKGRASARKLTHARILLQCDESGVTPAKKDQDVADALNISAISVERIRQRFVEEGLESALNPKVQERSRFKKLDGAAEAFLIATACTKAPEGRTEWTMQMLADKLVECQLVDSISDETVRKTLKKTRLNRG